MIRDAQADDKRKSFMLDMRGSHIVVPMSLVSWKTYVEVCRLGSFSAAAVELGFTQSAVSRQIATLERSVGVQLLARGPRGIEPTAAGEAFGHHARVVVNEIERAKQAALDTDSTGGGSLAIGAVPSVAAGVLPAAIHSLGTHLLRAWTLMPGLTPELEAKVASAELDLAIVTDAPPGVSTDHRLHRTPVGVDEMRVIVPLDHPLAGAGRQPLRAFANERWVEDNVGSAALLRRQAARAGFEPAIDLVAFDLLGKMAMVAAGHGLALIPATFSPSLRRDVVSIPLVDSPERGIYAITAATTDATTPMISALIDAVRAAITDTHSPS